MIKKFKIGRCISFIMFIVALVTFPTYGYNVDPPNEMVHQHISKEALEVWTSIPSEIEEHATKPITSELNSEGYNSELEDDIIIGSGEEDKEFNAQCLSEAVISLSALYPGLSPAIIVGWGMNVARPFCWHFYNPDSPEGGNYDDGWLYYGSGYRRADDLWENTIIPYYTGKSPDGTLHTVDQDRAYYWLGRTSHLLEDVTSIPHVHDGTHIAVIDPSHYEDFTANYFDNGAYNIIASAATPLDEDNEEKTVNID